MLDHSPLRRCPKKKQGGGEGGGGAGGEGEGGGGGEGGGRGGGGGGGEDGVLYLWRSADKVEEDSVQERQLPAQVNVTIILKKLVSTLLALQRQSTASANTTNLNNTNFHRDHTERFFFKASAFKQQSEYWK